VSLLAGYHFNGDMFGVMAKVNWFDVAWKGQRREYK